jgi:hypothetical protein
MAHDLYNNIKVSKVTAPISPAATGTITGTVVDTSGFRTNTFIISAGAQTTTGITVTPIVKSGTATGSLTSAVAAELIGTEAAAALDGTAGAGSNSKIGYIGTNRYVSCDLVVTGAATGVYSVQLIQSDPVKAPQS